VAVRPGAYARGVTRFVIDAPTLIHLVDGGVALDASHQLVGPSRIRSEALELMLQEVIAGVRDDRSAQAAHERMTQVKIRLLGDRVSRSVAWKIARQHGWNDLRDAEYLAVAKLQADALITVDEGLAARAQDIVPVADVSALFASA
jgi:predicted nucleic acid-binding protein